MMGEELDKFIDSLPDIDTYKRPGGRCYAFSYSGENSYSVLLDTGSMCYLYNIMGANIVKHEYLLVTGELVECHKGLINIGDMQDVREHLREDLYYNVIEFIGVGYCHRRTP